MAMVKTLAGLLCSRWAIAGLLAVAAWEGYLLMKPKAVAPVDELRQRAADDACFRALEKLPPLPRGSVLAVMRLEGDKTGFVTDRLRAIIGREGTYRQPEPSLVQRMMTELQIDESPVTSLDKALAAAKRVGAPFVIFGRVPEFRSDRQTAHIRMELQVADVATGRSLGQVLVVLPDPAEANRLGWYWRVLIWLAAVGLLPLMTWPLVRKVLEVESNPATLAMLLAYSLAAWVLAYGLTGFAIAGWLMAGVLLVAFVAAVLYNYAMFALVDRSR